MELPANIEASAFSLSAIPNVSATVLSLNCPKCWGIKYGDISYVTLPVAADNLPAIIDKSVDLPMPLFPIMAHFSPEDTEKLMF